MAKEICAICEKVFEGGAAAFLCPECRKRRTEEGKKMAKLKNKEKMVRVCPFCGSKEGYYVLEKVHRYLMFDFYDTPDGASEDITEYMGKRRCCRSCDRILPKSIEGR